MIHGHVALAAAQARVDDLLRDAAAHRLRPGPSPPRAADDAAPVTLRFGFPDDAASLARLAELDSARPPADPVLLAEVGGELRAALSLRDGAVIAEPFHSTAALVELLRARAGQLTGGGRARTRRWSLVRRSARGPRGSQPAPEPE